MEMSRLTRDGAAEPVSRDQILRREREQKNIYFPCSADHEQDWQPSYPVDPYYSYMGMEMSKLTRDGTAEPVSRDQTVRHVRGQGNNNFPFSADHEQDWQPYPA